MGSIFPDRGGMIWNIYEIDGSMSNVLKKCMIASFIDISTITAQFL